MRDYRAAFTPPHVADYLVELAEVKDGMKISDPCAGEGAIPNAINRAGIFVPIVLAVEINPDYFDALSKSHPRVSVYHGDFLKIADCKESDIARFPPHRVIMNPPFDGDLWCKFIVRAFDLLNDGGTLVSIIPTKFEGGKEGAHYRVQYLDFMDVTKLSTKVEYTEQYHIENWVQKSDGSKSDWGIQVLKLVKRG